MQEYLRIYIVEDEAIIRNDAAQAICDAGYTLAGSSSSGEKALQELDTTPCDVVLMDIVLDGPLNGIETAERVYRKWNIPVIFLTSYSDEITRYRAEAARPAGYILKPFTSAELRDVIEGLTFSGTE